MTGANAGKLRTFPRVRRPRKLKFLRLHNFLIFDPRVVEVHGSASTHAFALVSMGEVLVSASTQSSGTSNAPLRRVHFPRVIDRIARRHNRYPTLTNSESAYGQNGGQHLRRDATVTRELEKLLSLIHI